MFSIEEFQRLKSHLSAGTLGLGFLLNPSVRISISDNTSYGRGWEMRIHEEPTRRMCILTETDGQLTADYRYLVPLPNGGYDFQPLADRDFERQAQALFTEALGSLEQRRSEEIEATRRAKERLHALANDEAAMQRWRRLVDLLVSDPVRAEKIAKATGRAFTAPEGFLRRLRLSRVTDDLPWLALIAALRKEHLLVELDWREGLDDIATGIDELCAHSGHPSLDWAALSAENGSSAAALLNAASRALEADRFVLVCLDAGSDSFPTAMLPLASFEDASSLAASFGWQIKRHFA